MRPLRWGAIVTLTGALVALASCSSPPDSPPSSSQPSSTPSISFPTFGDNGCPQVSVSDCEPWAAPEPADLEWPRLVANEDRTVDGRNVGAAYLCALLPEAQAVGIVGPHPARVLSGKSCVLSSTDGPRWASSTRGTIHAKLAVTGRNDRATTAAVPEAAQRSDTPDRSHRSGVLRTAGADVRITLEYQWPQSTTMEDRAIKPAPERADDLWRELASEVRGEVLQRT